MIGKMAGWADEALAFGSKVGQGIKADKYIRKGLKQRKPTSAEADGLFSGALKKAKDSSIGTKLTANTGYKIKTEKLSDDVMESLATANTQSKSRATSIADELKGLGPDDAKRSGLEKQLTSLKERTTRMDGMLETGTFQREANMKEYASEYFGDELYGGFRTKAAIGAGVGIGVGAVGLRYATGGNLTRNGNGDRDIVGIPLI